MDRRIHLKIKIKSLAEEAKIIRKEVKKLSKIQDLSTDPQKRQSLGRAKHNLNDHRTGIVRWEARHSLLAYAILRGRPYERLEPRVEEGNYPDWKKIYAIAKRFGGKEEEVTAWIESAKEYIKNQ